MKNLILKEIKDRGITRLCHFTKSKNLSHILNDFNGILSTDKLPEAYRDINDFERYDGRLDYVCCSIQYPNIFYLQRIKDNDILFKDWIILSIKPEVMTKDKTLFSKVNAATQRGKYIKSGIEGLKEIYDPSILTSKRTIVRRFTMPQSCPTDIQAEVLIHERIPKEFIQGIIVNNEKQAKEEEVRMMICQVKEKIPIIVAPELFTRDVYKKIELGELPVEKLWK
ncbi:MAG: DUF4433 domain-containing protein [Clostridium lundense]|nr:DUF4433 domain-containing protein [Clostridium lundense]